MTSIQISHLNIKVFYVTNPFLANVPILCPLKTPETQRFSGVFREVKFGSIGQKWVNNLLYSHRNSVYMTGVHLLVPLTFSSYTLNDWITYHPCIHSKSKSEICFLKLHCYKEYRNCLYELDLSKINYYKTCFFFVDDQPINCNAISTPK